MTLGQHGTDARAFLQGGLASATRDADQAGRRARWLSWLRLGYALAATLLLVRREPWSWALAAGVALPFIPIVIVHRRAERRAQHARGVAAAAGAALARMERDWERIPRARTPDLAALGVDGGMARDLDVIGEVSLFRLLDVGLTGAGNRLIAWLLGDPAPVDAIHDRQQSVAELRQRPTLLLENARLSRFGTERRPPPTATQVEAFRAWCERPTRPLPRAFVYVGRIVTVLFVGAVIVASTLPSAREGAVLAVSLLLPIQVALAMMARRHLSRGLGTSVEVLGRLGDVVAVMRAIVDEREVAGSFGGIQRLLAERHAVQAFTRLQQLLDWNAVRFSPLMHFAANGAVGFDTHLADRVDRWHAAHGAQLPRWIDLVADAQALLALATLGFENPEWTMPTVHDDTTPVLDARDCGHPLLAPTVRISNPVELPSPGETLVITGSNMSGKTTYLRAIGLNALLAMAGGPACASAMTIRRCRVRTSVRVQDDLAHGASLFFAEVTRIRDVVSAAERIGEPPVLFLLDEILHGTNAADRRQATQLVLQRLVAAGSAGIITTHDAGVSAAVGAVRNAHFTDTVQSTGGAVEMTFDYRVRPGTATSTNALRILELMGLGGAEREQGLNTDEHG